MSNQDQDTPVEVTADTITRMLQRAYDKAAATENGSAAMTTAALGLAKLHGLIVNKSEDVTHKRTDEELDARLEQLLARCKESDPMHPSGDSSKDRLPTVSDVGTA